MIQMSEQKDLSPDKNISGSGLSCRLLSLEDMLGTNMPRHLSNTLVQQQLLSKMLTSGVMMD